MYIENGTSPPVQSSPSPWTGLMDWTLVCIHYQSGTLLQTSSPTLAYGATHSGILQKLVSRGRAAYSLAPSKRPVLQKKILKIYVS